LNTGDYARFAFLTEDGCVIANNCGYLLGPGDIHNNRKTGEKEATGLLGYAWNMQVKEFTAEQSRLSVETFRREFIEVKEYWYDIDKAMRRCIRTGKTVEFGHLRFDRKGPFLRMILPSGNALHYCRPRIEDAKTPWGEIRPTITYESLNKNKQWVRETTHPGKITENADQAISREILAHTMRLAARRGLDLRMHIHDENVALAEEDAAEEKLAILLECMEESPKWAKGLPLGAAGSISRVFMKD
jgi:DNA polymerase